VGSAKLKTEDVLRFTIPVKDLDRSEKFYTEIMGMRRIRRNNHMVFMQSGEDCFVLTYSENPIQPDVGNAHDIHHAFRVTPQEYVRAKGFLAEKGIPIIKEEDRRSGTFQGHSAYFSRSRPQRARDHRFGAWAGRRGAMTPMIVAQAIDPRPRGESCYDRSL
jgi:catechol 2,3-dioxygenase-like lactoylglutathione lyase family enzyme